MIGKYITIKNYYWMLAYAFGKINQSDTDKINGEEFDNIYDLFCFILTMELKKQIKRGLHRSYIPAKEETSNIKGKININESIKKLSHINKKLIVEYDEYNINTMLNKIIKTAAEFLLRSNKIVRKDYIRDLRKTLKYFISVDTTDPKNIRWDKIRYDRNNSSYMMMITISNFILTGLLVTEENGNYTFNNYIDEKKIFKLYEKFILSYYQYHYRDLIKASNPEIKWITDNTEKLPKMYSDIVLKDKNSNKKLIIDAKYYSSALQENEFYNKQTFKSNNLYQIFTYVKNEDKEKNGLVSGMLLYAKTDNNEDLDEIYNMDNNIIRISNLDLSKDFNYVKQQLNNYVDWFLDL